MKTQAKFYLIKVGNNAVSHLGFKYDLYKSSTFELEAFCGFKSKEELYKSATDNRLHIYTILSVNVTSVFEEVI